MYSLPQQKDSRLSRHRKQAGVLSLLVYLASAAFGVSADTVEVELYFDRLIPFTGLLYVPEANPKSVSASVDQIGKRFTKRIIAGSPNGDFTFMNSDEFEHNIFADDPQQNAIFDVGLMQPGETASMRIEWSRDSLVRIGCKIHPRMRAYLANISTEQFTAFERERGVREYRMTLEGVGQTARAVKLLLAGFDPMHIPIEAGEEKEITITRNGQPAASGSITRR